MMNEGAAGDTLPLIPEKGSICADVRPIIRAVFRDLDYLPPLNTELPPSITGDRTAISASQTDQWTERYKWERKAFLWRESELQCQHAARLSRSPLPNIYQLASPAPGSPLHAKTPHWRLDRGLIKRHDLVPTVRQNAARDGSLWIKNILNRSSCDVSMVEVVGHSAGPPAPRLAACEDTVTLQSYSVGEVETQAALPPLAPPPRAPPLQLDYMLCVPPQLDFINFTVGQRHTQSLRLVNVSKYEIRLSVRPPKRAEFDVALSSARGLAVSSGAAAELRVHFTPRDVRAVSDRLHVRASLGRHFLVPIACYMQPPVLDILIPNVSSSVLSCTPCETPACEARESCDVLELGARLLGAVHCAQVLLHCDAAHASFFMLTEDAWFSLSLDCITRCGSVTAGSFVLWPAWWGGGGTVRGCAWCRAASVGLHAAALRLVSSTAVVRHLSVVADTLLYGPEHLSIVAEEKDYDICGDGEPACEYYVHLGTAFPRRALAATVQLINHSPVTYSYYWSVRAWGTCSCLEDKSAAGWLGADDGSERLCVGAKEARDMAQEEPEKYGRRSENVRLVLVEPARGQVLPRSACSPHVLVPDAGARLGVQRAVLMLVLTDIPKESFPPGFKPMIISTKEVAMDPIPGVEGATHEVCEIVCAQMEVWWHVAPVRFLLDPPVLNLYHSRRLNSVQLDIKATQLFGAAGVRASWRAAACACAPAPLRLVPAHTCATALRLPLPALPTHLPETDIITMVADNEEWESSCAITRRSATRHPALQPEREWLGVVAPATRMHTSFHIFNDTYQHICWSAEAFRWLGEHEPSPACVGRAPCPKCHERACTCGLLSPARGALSHRGATELFYNVYAPECDGCVATLIRMRRTAADAAATRSAPGSAARAALVAYRVLAPRLYLRLQPCLHEPKECTWCQDEAGCQCSRRGSAVLRPRAALAPGRRACYHLQLTNVTPLPTAVHFDRDHDAADILKVKFKPNDFRVRPYGETHVRVVVEARKVCGRRLFVYRGVVERAYKPIYLVIDTAVEGVKISCEVPLGGGLKPDSFIVLLRSQKEEYPWEEGEPKPSTPEEVFADEDRKRETIMENRCRCPFQMVYIPPPPPPPRPQPLKCIEEEEPIPILSQAPSLTRVCACTHCSALLLPQLEQPVCLQFTALPLRTVRTRTLLLRNESVVTVHWSAAVRRWPRRPHRTLDTDKWAGAVREPGVAVACAPASGVLAAYAHAELHVRAYADCWGLYRDQLLIQVQDVPPIVLDVWLQADGAPLQLALAPAAARGLAPTMWMSSSDSERELHATNVSRATLTVHAYTTLSYEYAQSALPLRLYLRYYDTPPRSCPCLAAYDSELAAEESESGSVVEEVDTGFELYLAADHGPQADTVYTVSPEVQTVRAGEAARWSVALAARAPDPVPDVTLLLRLLPQQARGPCWQRGEPAALALRVRSSPRAPRLQLSCRELRVRLCALYLPHDHVLRVRKHFHVQNVGGGVLELGADTEAPWSLLAGAEEGARCCCDSRPLARRSRLQLRLEPRSSTEVCVEVCVSAAQEWPAEEAPAAGARCPAPAYAPRSVASTPLYIYDDDNILRTVPLLLELEFPRLRAAPALLDLRVVADGDTRKCYFSVSHSSRTETLDLETEWIGGEEFKIWPPCLRVAPGGSANVYLQYTAVWQAGPVEGCACVRVSAACACGAGGAGAGGAARWCRVSVPVRAAPARDFKFHVPRHDHTDDPHLLPPGLAAPGPPAPRRH